MGVVSVDDAFVLVYASTILSSHSDHSSNMASILE